MMIQTLRNHGRRRTRLEIVSDILELALRGTRKTHIMYRSNLSFEQLEKYLDLLLAKALLEVKVNDVGKVYQTTRKGEELLREIDKILKTLE